MDHSSITVGSLFVGASALNAFSQRIQTTTYNVANVSTAGFKPVTAQLADGPAGMGVELHSLMRNGQPVTSTVTAPAQSLQNRSIPGSTELEREIANLIYDQRAFQANAQTVRTADSLFGYVLDIKA